MSMFESFLARFPEYEEVVPGVDIETARVYLAEVREVAAQADSIEDESARVWERGRAGKLLPWLKGDAMARIEQGDPRREGLETLIEEVDALDEELREGAPESLSPEWLEWVHKHNPRGIAARRDRGK